MMVERCICDCVPACREQGKMVKSTTLRQSPKDTEWLTKLRCYPAATTLLPPGSPTPMVSREGQFSYVGYRGYLCTELCECELCRYVMKRSFTLVFYFLYLDSANETSSL
ncbi:hypothetical protein BDR03DRAFT_964360 [Suillus americanus]|nr:hypothetical protein BDR03DRAFT_964360 [Suillus americanus]